MLVPCQSWATNMHAHAGLEDVAKKSEETPWRVYSAHALSTWGDNMWWFAGGCYMLELHKESLRLTAIYGLVIAAAVIIFGASVGRCIDKTRRLTGKIYNCEA